MMNIHAYKTWGRDYATYKNIPIQFLDRVQQDLKTLKHRGALGCVTRIRYRFRGPRINTDHRHTLKQDAHSFSVYLDYKGTDFYR